jgi:predicted HD phosphohydrolase
MSEITLDLLFDRLATRGAGAYGLSDVSQLEHALQSAALASASDHGDEFVIAALFHDIGHLVADEDVDLAAKGIDDRHEETSAGALSQVFGPEVSEPVRLHVAAKRYLCGADYYALLSADSKRSLALQGGPMDEAELMAFEAEPHFKAAIALRRIDDAAKEPGLKVPGLQGYRVLAKAVAASAKG